MNDALLDARDIHHSGTTLANHLYGTEHILSEWGCPPEVCAAGLLHSMYGILLPPGEASREAVRSVVGVRAESIIHHFWLLPMDAVHQAAAGPFPAKVGGIDDSVHPVDQALAAALVAVDVAGSLEPLLRVDPDPARMEHERTLFASSLHLLPPHARPVVAEVWSLNGVEVAE